MKYIKTFSHLGKNDSNIAGGKGASLSEMINAGIPVPDGYVVLADTFDHFLAETDLTQEIQAILATVNTDVLHTVENASEQIQSLIKSAEMPQDVADEITKQFKELDTSYVAVRSSATAEDGVVCSWAGQLSSYLNTTEQDLLEKIQLCWASLFTSKAIFYCFEKELHNKHISVAVVVQKMVNSEKSGVAFSVHPVTENPNQLIIEAGLGLGEAIVSGSVTPDSYVVTKQPQEIIDVNVNKQTKALYRSDTKTEEGFNRWHTLTPEQANQQVLSKQDILELSDIIKSIEQHYQFPCDIEWAYEDNTFYITQSRPITTLKNLKTGDTAVKQKYEKIFTRDTTAIIQQAWNSALIKHSKETFSANPPTEIPVIDFMNDGVIEVWENRQFNDWLMEQILTKNKKSREFYDEHIANYKRILNELEQYWDQGVLNTVDELKKLVNLIFNGGMFGFVVVYYSSYSEDTPDDIKKDVRKMRDEDVFFDNNDRLLRDSLVQIYPEIKGTETTIFRAEIEDIPSSELRNKRKQNMVFVGEKSSEITTIYEFAQANGIQLDYEKTPQDLDEGVLSGSTGYKGTVKGIVRVIKRKEQISSVKEGEIIVSPMTTPEYLPAMKKAAAFVTDEGGITCHAAIVARELGKPCVIGTKFATELLKDGDEVEVDADNGVVRVIE